MRPCDGASHLMYLIVYINTLLVGYILWKVVYSYRVLQLQAKTDEAKIKKLSEQLTFYKSFYEERLFQDCLVQSTANLIQHVTIQAQMAEFEAKLKAKLKG